MCQNCARSVENNADAKWTAPLVKEQSEMGLPCCFFWLIWYVRTPDKRGISIIFSIFYLNLVLINITMYVKFDQNRLTDFQDIDQKFNFNTDQKP